MVNGLIKFNPNLVGNKTAKTSAAPLKETVFVTLINHLKTSRIISETWRLCSSGERRENRSGRKLVISRLGDTCNEVYGEA